MSSPKSVVVIVGMGGMGLPIAQRLGSGRSLSIADYSLEDLKHAEKSLQDMGYSIQTIQVDVADFTSTTKLAKTAKELGSVDIVVHAAGVAPHAVSPARIYEVNLLGTANIIESFQDVIAPRGSMVCVASVASHVAQLDSQSEDHLRTAPREKLLSCPLINLETDDGLRAYCISKAANILRVQAATSAYGAKGARINTISPGMIATPMGWAEMAGPNGDNIRDMVETSATGRWGTPGDVAELVAFLVGPGSTFITGADVLIDGGALASRSDWGGVKTKKEN